MPIGKNGLEQLNMDIQANRDKLHDYAKNIDKIVLGFTPKNTLTYEAKEVCNDDALFVQGGGVQLFNEDRVMFPVLSHA